MMHKLVSKLDKLLGLPTVSAHCDIPCAIYDPSSAQIAALSVARFLDIIAELGESDSLTIAQQAKLSRAVREKEIHAEKVKQEVRVIWGDYFKQPQFDAHPNIHELTHNIMLAGSAAKQHVDQENGAKLVGLVNDFAKIFWETKGVATYEATCPYPPSMNVVYPDLK